MSVFTVTVITVLEVLKNLKLVSFKFIVHKFRHQTATAGLFQLPQVTVPVFCFGSGVGVFVVFCFCLCLCSVFCVLCSAVCALLAFAFYFALYSCLVFCVFIFSCMRRREIPANYSPMIVSDLEKLISTRQMNLPFISAFLLSLLVVTGLCQN